MNEYWILVAILLPVLGSVLISLIPFSKRGHMLFCLEAVVLVTSVIVWVLILGGTTESIHVVRFVHNLSISFKIDGMSMVFAGLISILWPLATLYAFEYMEQEKNEKTFFLFYGMTYGVTLGISFAHDMMTMYFFYELLTLTTVPLVVHALNRESIHAARKYLYYSLGGAAFALMAMVFIIVYGESCDFVYGGVLNMSRVGDKASLLLWIYFFAFMGFGVKAAIWPLSSWLPKAGVAPTPVTALLHAVAVVNAGAFAIIRLTYYSFGVAFLRGTWVQYAVMAFAMFTIVYGCSRAVKETHIKRRLAFSTVSNLSYIVFGVTLMTPLGLVGALAHFVCHGVMKMCTFLCAGSFMHQTGKHYVYEMDGMGKQMPIVFGTFTVSALGLVGVPGFAGFISKWNLTAAAVDSGVTLAYFGVACLLISALLTAIYLFSVVTRAFFTKEDFDGSAIREIKDPTWKMCVPLLICAAGVILLGWFSEPLIEFFGKIANGY
ncbi:MAG: proton-conducting membrane transporter [Lachnospiraceae bacterium]|nr:proton-conducting membrane transporter [Lachnospiraceae bacterium]